jgi:hypothetical protein
MRLRNYGQDKDPEKREEEKEKACKHNSVVSAEGTVGGLGAD